MADVKISELPALTTPDGAEELVVNDAGTTKKITITNATSGSLAKAGGTISGNVAITGKVKAAAGTVTAPSVTFTADPDTGIFLRTANTIGITTNGQQRLEVDSAGNFISTGKAYLQGSSVVTGPASVTSFTGTSALGITVKGSTAATDYSGIDFKGNNQTTPVARIAALTTGGGSKLSFGTSNSYGSGITNTAMTIDFNGATTFTRSGGKVVTVDRAGSDGTAIGFENDGTQVGTIQVSGTTTSYNTSSDHRLKTNVQPMTGATARLMQLNPVNFEWISSAGDRVDGFLAHELGAVIPEAASGTLDAMMDEEYQATPAVLNDEGVETTPAVMATRSVPDYQGIDQAKVVPLLVATLQEALARIEALEA